MAHEVPIAPTYESQVALLMNRLALVPVGTRRMRAPTEVVRPAFEDLLRAFVRNRLEDVSDVRYNENVAVALLSGESFDDLLNGHADAYTVRKHMQDVMRAYLKHINAVRQIKVSDAVILGLQLESIGLNLGVTSSSGSRSRQTGGNVVAMTILSGFAIAVVAVLMGIVLLRK